jgi:hypothetical protein
MNNTCLVNEIHDDIYCVYKHTNILNGKVYIGITCQDPKKRWGSGYGYYKNEYFWRSIQKYGWNEGFTHEILFEELTYEEACQIEIELISKYNSTNPNCGYNHHQGGKYNDYDTRQKIRDNSALKKAVLQYSKDGEFLAEYESMSEASRQTGIGIQEISFACSGKLFSAGGYFWCDRDNSGKIKLDVERYREDLEKVLQFDLQGNLLHEYKNIYDAADQTGIGHYKLFCVCFDKLEPICDFLFCYESKKSRVTKWIKQNNMHDENKPAKPKKRHAGKRCAK